MEAAEWSMCWSLRTKRTSETCWWNNLRSEVKVRKADNGATGLQRVSELVPDVIFVDVKMPVMDGFLFVSELRQNSETAKVQVVLVTAINIPDVESRALATGEPPCEGQPARQLDNPEPIRSWPEPPRPKAAASLSRISSQPRS